MRFPREVKLQPKDDIVFQITSWYASDEEYGDDDDEDENSRQDNTKYLVKVFGVTELGESVSVNLTDFPPFFFIKCPVQNVTDYGLRSIKEYVVEKLPFNLKNGLDNVKLLRKKDFWGFTNSKQFAFIRLTFKNLKAFRAASKMFSRKISLPALHRDPILFKVYESNIEPFLRLAHIKDIDPAGWVKIPANKYDHNLSNIKPTKCQIDITARWNDIEPAKLEKMAPIIIASFDIECTSSHGDFPVACKKYKKVANELIQLYNPEQTTKEDITNEILLAFDHSNKTGKLSKVFPKSYINPSNAIKRHADDIFNILKGRVAMKTTAATRDTMIKNLTETLDKCLPALEGDPVIQIGTTVHTYGDKDTSFKHIITLGSCDPIQGAEVQVCNTEQELILAWRDLINSLDPDVIIGYNIFGFDMSYLYDRAKEHHIEEQFCNIGKIKDHISKFEEKTLSSSALGDNILKYIDMEGRVLIDVMKLVQRDHKLDSYKLDTVATTFLGGKIKSIDDIKLTLDNTKGITQDSYIKLNDDTKYKVLQIDTTTNTLTLDQPPPINSKTWGLAKDDITPRQIFECQNGTSTDRALIAKYCLKDCALCNYLVMKLETLANNVGMANVCTVPLSYIFMRGQGIKIFSLVSKQCRADDFLIPVLSKPDERKCGVCHKYVKDTDAFIQCSRCKQKFHQDSCVYVTNTQDKFICDTCAESTDAYEDDGYEGAIVLEPKEGIYIDTPISVLDYASLYPSSMISENLSHDCIVMDPKYDNLEGFEYLDIQYDIYGKQGDKKVKTGIKTCRFVQLPEKGVIPRILMHLLKQRKLTRKKIEFKTVITHDNQEYTGMHSEDGNEVKITTLDGKSTMIPKDNIKTTMDTYDDFQKAVLDGLQLAYKVTANSLYGQCGARTSQIYMKEIAACTTATGRKMILMAKEYIESKATQFHTSYEPDIVYGDSVANYTPVTLQKQEDKSIIIDTIDNIAKKYGNDKWVRCIDPGRQDKEACNITGINVWTGDGWKELVRVIRHELVPHKKMWRVLTHTGLVDVTDDHSLLSPDGTKVSPLDLKIGSELLHKKVEITNSTCSSITKEEARIMGFFMGDGSCGSYDCKCGQKSSWALNNASLNVQCLYQDLCESVYPHMDWEILDTLESSGVYKLVPKGGNYGDIKTFVSKYRSLLYSGDAKIVPDDIINSSYEVREAFFDGFYDADGDKDAHGYIRFDQKNQLSCATLYMLASSLGYNISINSRTDKPDVFRLTLTKSSQKKNPIAIKKLHEIPYDGFVYDFTTENHQFQVGVGSIIGSNTDSIFCQFEFKDPQGNPINGHQAIPLSRELGIKISNEFKKHIKPPHDLEWEKLFYPFILFSKKRYCANKYEHDDHKYKMNSMGIVLKRRDNAQIVKTIYGGILNIILNEQNIKKSITFLKENLQFLIDGKFPMEELIITKSLKSEYKDPSKIAHKVLADRMGERDEGTRPQVNDRIPFVYIQTPPSKEKKVLQGERIEHPDYIRQANLKPDYEFYITNQIMKPCLQLYALILEQLEGYKPITDYTALKPKLLKEKDGDTKKAKDKWNDLREDEVKKLLFDPFLIKLQNKRNNNRSIMEFFKPAS